MINYKPNNQKKVIKNHHFSQVKLPIIDRFTRQKDKNSLSKNKQRKLPKAFMNNTNINTISNAYFQNIARLQNSQIQQKQSGLQFKEQISIKLNQILNQNQILNTEYYNNDLTNFEEIIKKNKEKLKQEREKRQFSRNKQLEENGKKIQHNRVSQEKIKKEKESQTIEVKLGQLNNRNRSSMSNYNLERKKRKSKNLNEKGGNKIQMRINQLKSSIVNRINHKKISKVLTQSDVGEDNRHNLFDNIQNYLANPHNKKHESRGHSMSQKKLISNKKDLQIKLKQIKLKLTNMNALRKQDEEDDLTGQQSKKLKQTLQEYGIFDWRRVEILNKKSEQKNEKRLSMVESSFEKEVNYLSKLQQKSQKSIDKYINNQKMLIDLRLKQQMMINPTQNQKEKSL